MTTMTTMTAQQLREKISAWLSDKTNHEGDLVDFLVDDCGVEYNPKWEDEDEEEEEEDEKGKIKFVFNCDGCGRGNIMLMTQDQSLKMNYNKKLYCSDGLGEAC